MVARGWQEGLGMTANGYRASFSGDENVMEFKIVVMVASVCEYTKNHWTVHFKRQNFMLCELYLIFFLMVEQID